MKILLLNKDVYWGGGAGKSTYRLWQGYQSLGHEVKILTRKDKPIPDEWSQNVYHLESGVSEELGKLLFEDGWMDLFLPAAEDFHQHGLVKWADVIHIQNLHGNYFPYKILPKLCDNKPVVWTFRDFWAFTGGCPYPTIPGCYKFRSSEGCCDCPELGNYPLSNKDTTQYHWKEKRKVLNQLNFWPVFASRFSQEFILSSNVSFRNPSRVIPNGIEVESFRPIEKAEARHILGIHDFPTVIIQGSCYKNPQDAMAALHKLEDKPQVLLFGPHVDMDVFKGYEGGVINLNEIDHVTLTTAFSAADVFLFPSKAETFGNVVAESLSAGTICVGYDNSSLPEIVGCFGSVCRYGDIEKLVELTRHFLKYSPDPKILHDYVVENFSLDRTMQSYSVLLEEITNRRG